MGTLSSLSWIMEPQNVIPTDLDYTDVLKPTLNNTLSWGAILFLGDPNRIFFYLIK